MPLKISSRLSWKDAAPRTNIAADMNFHRLLDIPQTGAEEQDRNRDTSLTQLSHKPPSIKSKGDFYPKEIGLFDPYRPRPHDSLAKRSVLLFPRSRRTRPGVAYCQGLRFDIPAGNLQSWMRSNRVFAREAR